MKDRLFFRGSRLLSVADCEEGPVLRVRLLSLAGYCLGVWRPRGDTRRVAHTLMCRRHSCICATNYR